MRKFNVSHKLSLSIYPDAYLMCTIQEGNSPIYMKHKIKKWESYNSDTVKPLICYELIFTEFLTKGIFNTDKINDKFTYGFIVDTKTKDDKQIFICEFRLCEDAEYVENMRKYIAAKNGVTSSRCWVFEYGNNYNNENINKIINTKYAIEINNKEMVKLSDKPLFDGNEFVCIMNEIIDKEEK